MVNRQRGFALSAKILATFIAASLAVFLYIAYSVVVSVKENTYISEREKASILLDSVASEIGMSLYLGFEDQAVQKTKELLSYPDVLTIEICNISGQSIGRFGALNMGSEALKDAIRVKKPLKERVSGKEIGSLELYYSNRNYLRLINNFEQMLFKFFAVAALIFALALLFVRHMLAPLGVIAQKMREYIPGKHIMLENNHKNDEIGSIIVSFKAMQVNIDSFLEEIRRKDSELMRQSKLKALADMINAVAHHWRQPLNAIGIILQDMEFAYKYGELDENYIKTNVATSMAILQKMSKTIDDFRLFFMSSDEKEEIDLFALALEVMNAFEEQLSSSDIGIRIEGSGFFVSGQRVLLKEVLATLISNSKDAILEYHKGRIRGDIAIRLDPQRRELECCDNGGGMPEEVLLRAFEPYYTTKEQGKGVGLGLFMSKTVLANMGADISLANTKEGTCATISFGVS